MSQNTLIALLLHTAFQSTSVVSSEMFGWFLDIADNMEDRGALIVQRSSW